MAEEVEEVAEEVEGPGRSGNGEAKSRLTGRGRRSELARRGRGLGGRSGSPPAANIPGTHDPRVTLGEKKAELDEVREMMTRECRCECGEDSELLTGFHCAVYAEAAEGGGRPPHVRHGSPGRGRRNHRSGEVVLVDVLLLLLAADVALLVLADGGRRRRVV